nr:hypothetical protein BaRGS_017921 [Batillaria attramentaria]
MRVYLNVELRRVLNTLPSHLRSRSEVTSLNSRITTMVAKYPLVESEVDALGKEAMDTTGCTNLALTTGRSAASGTECSRDGTVNTTTVLAFLCTTEALQIANDIMQPVNFECPDGESITAIQSWHSDWHDDRQWAFGCSKVPEPVTLSNCKWTDWLYELGTHDWKYSCNGNRVIKGCLCVSVCASAQQT